MVTSKVIQSNGHYVDGQWMAGQGMSLESNNPANGALVWQGSHAGKDVIFLAHKAAQAALAAWSIISFEKRAEYVIAFGDEIEKQRDALALLISKENGKPLWESVTEVNSVIAKIKLSIQAYKEKTYPNEVLQGDIVNRLRFKPQGIVVILGPFNFPAHLSNGHIIPALLAGNTILYKPSEQTPAVAELIMQCWHDSHIPAGVINCLQGDVTCAKALLDQDIQGVYFTGSFDAGFSIHRQFSNRLNVILALEMGGNNPLIIDEVSDLDAALYHTLLSTLISTGQRCTCARRVIIPNSPWGDDFLKAFIRMCQSLTIGAYDSHPVPFMGPVISYAQAQRLLESQAGLIRLGANALLLMHSLSEHTGFLSPGILDMSSVPNPPDQEIFGPLIQVYRYTDFEQAIDIANQTRYGLMVGILSDDEGKYNKVYHQVSAGLINWNQPTTGALSSLPFGGVGLSGNHRPSGYSAADYCAYPIASLEQTHLSKPSKVLPGINLGS
ncbi:MAG: succinylglutamate-semialdehyde dehydrogenase [Legionella sp.]|nr:succinylglutamate-semialdehyde dehydrogenase [Legionella sp.]